MLDVLCGEVELGEYGEAIAVGDVLRRRGLRLSEPFFGTGLDLTELRFDRCAGLTGSSPPVMIAGEVHAIASVHVRLVRRDGAWAPDPGSAVLEPLETTRATRRPPPRMRWRSDGSGRRWATRDLCDGDELLWGWRFTLLDASVEPEAPAGR